MSFMKVYKKGQIARFSIINEKQLNYANFNPKKSVLGYSIKRNKKYYFKFFSINQCRSWIYKDEIIIKNDTLYLVDKQVSNGEINVYIKDSTIPKQYYQNWQPDW